MRWQKNSVNKKRLKDGRKKTRKGKKKKLLPSSRSKRKEENHLLQNLKIQKKLRLKWNKGKKF